MVGVEQLIGNSEKRLYVQVGLQCLNEIRIPRGPIGRYLSESVSQIQDSS